MADEQQLRILRKQPANAWNAWRSQVPEIRIDLSHGFLIEANHGPVLAMAGATRKPWRSRKRLGAMKQ